MTLDNPRELRGFKIYGKGDQIIRINATHYKVRSQSKLGSYDVRRNGLVWTCSCPDSTCHNVICKHIYAVQFSLRIRQQVRISNPIFYEGEEVTCPKCLSVHFKKDGKRYTKFGKVQRFRCLNCHYKFSYREGFDRMKQDPKVITLCMDLHFKGVSLRQISDHLKQFYGIKVWQSTIYYWIKRYVKLMKKYVTQFTPNVGGVWHVDETMVNVRGSKMGKGHYDWLWNLMDSETRFILASQIHKTRYTNDARDVLQSARKRAMRLPAILVSDSLKAYERAYRKEIKHGAYPQPEHVKVSPIKEGMQNMPIERWHGTLKDRTKAMRGMHKSNTAQNFADGFVLYYDFIRDHSSLGMTPAQKANIDLRLDGNRWLELIKIASQKQKPHE